MAVNSLDLRNVANTAVDLLPAEYEAEQYVLGILLYNNDAISGCDGLEPQHFREMAHGKIFTACRDHIAKGLLADPITVWNVLSGDAALGELGGAGYLADLVDTAPPTSNLRDYARLVIETALRRHLIEVADQMRAGALTAETPPKETLEAAEGALYQMGREAASAGGFVPFSDAVDQAIDMAAQAYQRDGALSGLSTGLTDLDRKLGGLHPSDLLIVAGRPSSGKTSLATNIAFHLAKNYAYEAQPDGTRKTTAGGQVAFFSLEMSEDQLAGRIISEVARVPSDKIRRGDISAIEFGLLREAGNDIRSIPLHIDATGGISIGRLAARARRLKRRQGLDLIVVDYLQLLTTDGRQSGGNRTQEVSEITGGLKALAKELQVPVIALSQLSRKVEERPDKRPQLADLRECVIGSTLLIDAETGKRVAISDLKAGQRVLGAGRDMKIATGTVAEVWRTGPKPVFEVTSRTGRVVTASANHPFLTQRGWVRLDELNLDQDRLAVPFRSHAYGVERPQEADLCRLLGYLAGNGSYQDHRTLGLIIPDQSAFDDACGIIKRHWPEVEIKVRANGYNDAWISRTFENGYGKPFGNPMREWLREIGLLGNRDTTKNVPDFVFSAGTVGAAEYLAGYLETDGCVTQTNNRWSVRFDTTSHDLAQGVAALLTKLGVASIISAPVTAKHARNPIYRISVAQNPESLRRFAEIIPARGIRGQRLKDMAARMSDRATRYDIFILPKEVSTHAASIAKFRDQGKGLSRTKAAAILATQEDAHLRTWMESDYLWDQIRSIEPAGEQETFDVRIPGMDSFIANGVAVHNSGSIEQDADAVMFIYREEYYLKREEPDSSDAKHLAWLDKVNKVHGIAEVIIGKQRHGPIGTVRLHFNEDTTTFSNLARKSEGYGEAG